MQQIIGAIVGLFGIVGTIGSLIALKFWAITLVIMSILKLTGAVVMPWFAGAFTAGAISTGLWMLFLGLVMVVVSMVVAAIGGALIEG